MTKNLDSEEITVKFIVEKYLKENGYDGLYQPDSCACEVDDLMPCDGDVMGCEAGVKTECSEDDYCPADGRCDFHIGPR